MMDSVNSNVNLQEKTNKYQHIDPPWLWVSVFICSISIHVLAIFLFFSSWNQFKPWSSEDNQNPINIEFIEIDPNQEVKSVSQPEAKPQLTTQPSPSETGAKPTTSTSDSLPKNTQTAEEATNDLSINPDVDVSEPRQNNIENNQTVDQNIPRNIPQNIPVTPSPKPTPQTEFTPAPKPQINIPSVPIPTPEVSVPVNDLPWNRRQEIKLGQGTPLPGNPIPDSPVPTPEDSPILTPEDSPVPTPEDSPIPTPEVTPTIQGVGIRVNINPMLKDEVEKLRQENKIRVDGLPDVLAEYQGSPTKELQLDVVLGEYGLKPANLLASLVIDQDGNFQQAVIINIDPVSLRSDKNIYEQALNQVFSQENFRAGYNQDGSKPGLSNLYMKIQIDIIK